MDSTNKKLINIHNGQPKIITVNGFKSNVIYWSRNLVNVTLEFTVTSSEDNMIVTCGDGQDMIDYCQLKIKTVPGVITHLNTNDGRTYESILLQWDPPVDNGGDIVNYIIEISPQTSGNSTYEKCQCTTGTCITSMTACNVTGLLFDVTYTFTVLANNSVGKSNDGVTKIVTISAKVPPPVNQVHVCMDFVSGTTTLNVHWAPCPVVIDNPSLTPPVTNYSVNISGGVGLGYQKSCAEYNTTVTQGTHYIVNVSVNNKVGSSSPAVSNAFATTWLTLMDTVIPTHMVYSTAQCVTGDGFFIGVSSDIIASPPYPSDPMITTTVIPYTPNIIGTIPMFREGATVIYKLQVYKTNTPIMSSPIVVVAGDITSTIMISSTNRPVGTEQAGDAIWLTETINLTIIMLILWISALMVYFCWIKSFHIIYTLPVKFQQ